MTISLVMKETGADGTGEQAWGSSQKCSLGVESSG